MRGFQHVSAVAALALSVFVAACSGETVGSGLFAATDGGADATAPAIDAGSTASSSGGGGTSSGSGSGAATDAGSSTSTGTSTNACGKCLDQECVPEETACTQDDCINILKCAQTMSLQTCGDQYPDGISTFNALSACARASCSAECQ